MVTTLFKTDYTLKNLKFNKLDHVIIAGSLFRIILWATRKGDGPDKVGRCRGRKKAVKSGSGVPIPLTTP